MKHGLVERFRAMEDVGRMWQRQARLGIAELERGNGREFIYMFAATSPLIVSSTSGKMTDLTYILDILRSLFE